MLIFGAKTGCFHKQIHIYCLEGGSLSEGQKGGMSAIIAAPSASRLLLRCWTLLQNQSKEDKMQHKYKKKRNEKKESKLPRLDSLPAFRMFGCLHWDVWEVVPSHHHARESQRWHCTCPYGEMVLGILQCSNVHLNGIIGECEELFLLNFENLTCMFLLQVFVYL